MNRPMQFGEDVALFIDWENFKISLAVGHRHPNVSALKEEVSNHGRVVVARAYADWVTRSPELRGASQFNNDPPALYAAGIEPVYVPTRLALGGGSSTRTTRVKNSVDVKMTADCIEIAHSHPNIGAFVLVSGDSDFIHVISALRTMGKRVIVIGVSWATSRRFADSVDDLIFYDQDIDTVVPTEPVQSNETRTQAVPVVGGRVPTRHAAPPAAGKQDLAAIIAAIEEIVRTERQAGGTPLLTSIKQRLMRRYPEFDEKKVGFSGFKKLMSRVAQDGNIRLITAGLVDWAIMADEETPTDANDTPTDNDDDDVVVQAQEESPSKFKRSRFSFGRRRPTEVSEPVVVEVDDETAEDEPSEEAVETPSMTDDTTEEVAEQSIQEAAPEREEESTSDDATTVSEPAPANGLAGILAETLPHLNLPPSQPDGLDGRRVADIIIMADTLENQEAVSHVAFNFLVGEVCQALGEGLKAEQLEITQRWGQAFSRLYVTKLVRSLGNADLFTKGWHTATDEESGRSRRLRTFYLNRTHPLVEKVLQDRWEPQEHQPQEEAVAVATEGSEPEEVIPYGDTSDSTEPSFFSRLFRPR